MSVPHSEQTSGRWIDFYALLEVPADADIAMLRRVIGARYAQATSNYDHRDLNQRYYYQALTERILPQCRRILLDSQKRELYDQQCHLHREGDPKAMDYVTFMAALKNPGGIKENSIDFDNLPSLNDEGAVLPEKLREEMLAAQSLVADMESGLALDLLPTTSVTRSNNDGEGEKAETNQTTPALNPQHEVKNPVQAAPPPAAAPVQGAMVQGAMDARQPESTLADGAPRVSSEAFVRVAAENIGQESAGQPYLETTKLGDNASTVAAARRARRASQEAAQKNEACAQTMIINGRSVADSPPASRLTVGETPKPTRSADKHTRHGVLSSTSVNLMTAIVAVLLTITIQYFTNKPATATGGRVPLIISYSSEMQPFLEQAKAEFEKTENGALIEVILQPQDSRDGMRQALGLEGSPPDAWIPSEAVWPQRYNQVAASHQRSVINSSTPLALSPLVLVARADKAASLKKRFPNRRIPSWEALRVAVAQDAPGRLGMTDPKKSGSGAIARYFMAHDWSRRNNVAWNEAALSNASLWKWMGSFEDNVPATSGMTSDMVKDMVLGTRGLYWWAIAYESDAIYWLNQDKPVEIFYLPMTNFADHPFCHVARLDAHPQARTARIMFERFLRTEPMQKALLQSGFRPTEIDLQSDVPNNPFRQDKFRNRGLQITGFPLDERLNYRLINSMNVQWDKRFTS